MCILPSRWRNWWQNQNVSAGPSGLRAYCWNLNHIILVWPVQPHCIVSITSAHWSHRNRSLPTGWCIREIQDTDSFHEFSAKAGGKRLKSIWNVYWKQNFCLGLVSKIKTSFFCGRLMYIHIDNGKHLFDMFCCISGLIYNEQETFQIWKSKWTRPAKPRWCEGW